MLRRCTLFTYNSLNEVHFSRSFTKLNSLKSLHKLKTPYKYVFLASAAAIGISAYAMHLSKMKHDLKDDTPNIVAAEKIKSCLVESEKINYDEAINKSRDILLRLKDEIGIPGIVIGVSVDGETVWTEGLGYADVENRVSCSADTVMRIASISKSITMAAVAKLMEQEKLDLDKPIQEYVPSFPHKDFDGNPVVITCRHLVSHLAGIRHYDKPAKSDKNIKDNVKGTNIKKSEFELEEYYIKEKHDVQSSLSLFKDDPLISKPGTKFIYTTHGWTLISAVIEAIAKENFMSHMKKLFKKLGMENTYFDDSEPIIYNRSRNYRKDKNCRLINTPYVDNSYKWAGGGMLSTVPDLLHFANAMLYSSQLEDKVLDHFKNNSKISNQKSDQQILPGFLTAKTIETIWKPVVKYNDNAKYAMGWITVPEKTECKFCEECKFMVYHTGGAIGASSILLIQPKPLNTGIPPILDYEIPPKGIIVVILTNLMPINLFQTAKKIADIFNNHKISDM